MEYAKDDDASIQDPAAPRAWKGMWGVVMGMLVLWAGQTQAARLEGVVRDQAGTPLAQVNILLKGMEIATTSSDSGTFALELAAGTYTLVLSRVGLETVERRVVLDGEKLVSLGVQLGQAPVQLAGIVVERQMMIGDPQKIDRIPGAAHYIGPQELARQDNDDIHRILRQIPGVNIQEEEGYGLRPNIGMRGTGVERNEKITVMEDGVLIAPAPYASPAAYYFPTAGRMDGVEVRKGSSQIKYGPFTTGGALNLISARIPTTFGGRARASAGQDSERRLHATVGNAHPHIGWLVETYQAQVDGFKRLDGGGNTGFDKKDYLAKLRFNSRPQAALYQELTFKFGYTDEISNETYLGLTDVDFARTPYRRYAASQRDRMDAEHRQLQATYFARPSAGIDITTTVYRNDFKRNWYKLDKIEGAAGAVAIAAVADPQAHALEYAIATGQSGPEAHALEVKANNRQYYARGIQTVVGLQRPGHELEVGLRMHRDEMDRFQWVDDYRMDDGVMRMAAAGVHGTESNRIQSAQALALFAQYQGNWGRWTLTPGLRFEDIGLKRRDYGKADPQRTGAALKRRRNDVQVWIPGIGMGYRVAEGLNVFGGIHKGFAPPGDQEGTKAEESINYEAGLRYNRHMLGVEAVAFFNDYRNLLGSQLDAAGGLGDPVNGGQVDVVGLELGVDYDLGHWAGGDYGVPVRLSYTYAKSEFRTHFDSDFAPWGTVQEGFELPYAPRHQLGLGLGLERRNWSMDLSANYVGRMRTRAGQGAYEPRFSIEDRLVLDLVAEYVVAGNSRIVAKVRNLTDRQYMVARRPAGARPGLPRTVSMGVETL